jgi:hypothetical protein
MAYVGQTRGLRKYSLGLTQAELKTMKFSDVQEKLSKQFSGANAAYLETYAGQMALFGTAAGEASEIIGKGLMDALMILSGDTSVEELAVTMETVATNTSKAITEIAKLGNAVGGFFSRSYGAVDNFSKDITDFIDRITFNSERIAERNRARMGGYPSSALGGTFTNSNSSARKKAEADAVKRAKELAAMQKKTLDTQKKQNALTKASKVLDLDRISVTAALRGQISETDRLSLQLQLVLLDKNESAALKLSAELTEAVKRHNDLKAALLSTPEAPNPYRNWMPPTFNVPTGGMGSKVAADYLGIGALGGAGSAGIVNVIVNLDGDVVGGAVTNTQVNQSLSGTFSDVSRYNGRGAPSIK